MYLQQIQNKLLLRAALLMFLVTAAATIVRPFIVSQSWIFTAIGSLNAIVLGGLWVYLRKKQIVQWHKRLVIIVGFCTIVPLMSISGGVNSQFTAILPCIPLFICLMIGPKAAWQSTGFIIFLVVFYIWAIPILPDIAGAQQTLSKTYARGFWLVLACILSSAFATAFYQINQTLGDKLRKQAFQDELTGLANRRSILECLEKEFSRAYGTKQVLAVLMLDVDHFKNINDTFGHAAGDKCLIEIAKTLKAFSRKKSDYVGRYGGEEFLIVLPNTDSNSAFIAAEHLRTEISKLNLDAHGCGNITLSVTIGVAALMANECDNVESLISTADQALYKGKQLGRNQTVSAPCNT